MLPHIKIKIYNLYITTMWPPRIKAISTACRQEIILNFKLYLQDSNLLLT